MHSTTPDTLGDRPHILVVDDDDRIRGLLSRYLSAQGFVAATARDPRQARAVLDRLTFDALVVDVMMPGETGFIFVQKLRETNDVPVIFLTARGEVDDRIAGLESGGDDYLPKPFEPRELVLRLQAVLRRRPKKETAPAPFRIGGRLYDPALNVLTDTKGEDIRLTTVEGNLLRALAGRAGEAVSREELAALCDMDAGERTIDVQVTRLRKKLETDGDATRYLQTVRGKGYLLRIEEL